MSIKIFNIAFERDAKKEFLKLDTQSQQLVAKKILDLKNANFSSDKSLKGKHKGKFRKRAGKYRIIYLKENNLILITIIRIAHRKEVY